MREVVASFQEGFSVGLRKNKAIANNVECLAECYNLIPTAEGLLPREQVVNPFKITAKWPFPFLYVGANHMLLFTDNTVYGIDALWEPYLLYTVPSWGGLPHFADFQDYIVWATPNGTWQYKEDLVTPMTNWKGDTACNFKFQLLMGEARLPKGPSLGTDGAIIDTSVEIDSLGTVAWGIIGDTEFRYQLGQENGWMKLPYIGKILKILSLGDNIYVYHQNGIHRLIPAQQPIPTFGSESFGRIGPLNRECVAGDDNAHLMLGADYKLYLILPERALSDQGKTPVNLDYEEFMQKLRNPIVSFDAVEKHWWIGDEHRCFIYNGRGLAETSFTPSSLGRYGALLGCGVQHGEDCAIVTTNTSSLNVRAMKTIMAIEADIQAEDARVQVLWRNDFRKPMKTTKEKRLDPRGFCFPVVSGNEFQIRVKMPDYKNAQLTKLWLRYKVTDRTSVRGITNAGAPTDSTAN